MVTFSALDPTDLDLLNCVILHIHTRHNRQNKYLSAVTMTHEFHFVVDVYTVLLVYEPLRGPNTVHEDLVLPFYHIIPLL